MPVFGLLIQKRKAERKLKSEGLMLGKERASCDAYCELYLHGTGETVEELNNLEKHENYKNTK